MLTAMPLPYKLIALVLVFAALIVASVLYVEGERAEAWDAGALAERSLWIEDKRKLAEKAAADLHAAQAKIDQVERDRLAAAARSAIALADLNEIIARQEAENAVNTDPSGRNACLVSDPVGRELRNALDSIGRGPR